MGGGALKDSSQLCPYAAMGHCYFEDKCPYLHGSRCQVCGLQVLHPHDPEQRRAHEKVRSCCCCCSSRESTPDSDSGGPHWGLQWARGRGVAEQQQMLL